MSRHEQASFHEVTCPSCFQTFEVAGPVAAECPAEWDYDCEICCRPMVLHFREEDGEVVGEAQGLGE